MMKVDGKLVVLIDPKWWLRGEGGGVSYLLRADDGKMCCLGFAALEAGFEPQDIKGVQDPTNRDEAEDISDRWHEAGLTSALGSIMEVNDAKIGEMVGGFEQTTTVQSEVHRRELLKRLGVRGSFIFQFTDEDEEVNPT